MILAGILGFMCGLLTVLVWWLQHYMALNSDFFQTVKNSPYIVPALMVAVIALMGTTKRKLETDFADDFSDLIEEFHLGIQRSPGFFWAMRSIASFIGAVFIGLFGVEGVIVSSATAVVQAAMRRYPKIFLRLFLDDIEIRQIIVDCIFAAAFSIVLGTPFTAAILTLEIFAMSGSRVRTAAFISSLTAYGTWLLCSKIFSINHFSILSTFVSGYRPMFFGIGPSLTVAVICFLSGILISFLTHLMGTFFVKVRNAINKQNVYDIKSVLVAGIALSLTVMVTPDAFIEPWRQWSDLSWNQMSSAQALLIFTAKIVAIFISIQAFSGLGILTPFMFVLALLGYFIGNLMAASWALPLSIAFASAAIPSLFTAPIAAISFILEGTHDGMLWFFSLAVVSGIFTAQIFLKTQALQYFLLAPRKLRFYQGRYIEVLLGLKMKDAMVTNVSFVAENSSFSEIQRIATSSAYNVIVVRNDSEVFRGILSLRQIPNNADIKGIRPVDLLDKHAVEVSPEDSLDQAFQLLRTAPALVVLDEERKFRGLVLKSQLQARYNREVGRKALSYYTTHRT